ERDAHDQRALVEFHQGEGGLELGVAQLMEQVSLEGGEGNLVRVPVQSACQQSERCELTVAAQSGDSGGGGAGAPAEGQLPEGGLSTQVHGGAEALTTTEGARTSRESAARQGLRSRRGSMQSSMRVKLWVIEKDE